MFHKDPTEFKSVNGKLVRVKSYPTMNLATKDSRILAQGGNLFEPGGNPIPREKWPKWVLKELDKCSEETLQEHGFDMWWREDRKSTRLNSSHSQQSRMPSSA